MELATADTTRRGDLPFAKCSKGKATNRLCELTKPSTLVKTR